MINFKVIGFGIFFCFVVIYILNQRDIKNDQEFHLHANKIQFSNYSKDQWQKFYKKKEVLYEQRRMKVQQYCSTQPETFSRSWRYLLWVFYSTLCIILVFSQDPKDGILMCPIAKIASTTYIMHFSKIGFLIILLHSIKLDFKVKQEFDREEVKEYLKPPNNCK